MAEQEYLEYHIEISSIIEILNETILSTNSLAFDRDSMFEVIKKAVISSNEKSFLSESSHGANNPYFLNYFERAKNVPPKYIPDLFEYRREFYDLNRQIYIFKDRTSNETFGRLFLLYILVIQRNMWDINEFLNFQLFDNFHGNKYHFYTFLEQIIEKEKNSSIFSSIIESIIQYVDTEFSKEKMEYEIELQTEESEESLEEYGSNESTEIIENSNSNFEWEKYLDERKVLQLQSKFSLEEIKTYFSFLYKEKSVGGIPFLSKNQVEDIFKNGLTIPKEPLTVKYKLNVDNSYPKKMIDTGIYKFYVAHSIRNKEKKELVLFFGSYIEDYSKVFESMQALENQSKNIKNYTLTLKNKIVWSKYLPQDK